jgi:hypothetical protein
LAKRKDINENFGQDEVAAFEEKSAEFGGRLEFLVSYAKF